MRMYRTILYIVDMNYIIFIVFGLFFSSGSGLKELAEHCEAEKCQIGNGCSCLSHFSPLPTKETPQFVTISFEGPLKYEDYDSYIFPLLGYKFNPDNTPVSATFYVSHEGTSYQTVNKLYNLGHEIGVNSISKSIFPLYWAQATVEQLVEEFLGQKQLMSQFAQIPFGDIISARTPHLEISGNRTFEAYSQSEIVLDNSWPSLDAFPLYPYTLDYLSEQSCFATCPNEAFPGLWEFPINNFVDQHGNQCNLLENCFLEDSRINIATWLQERFDTIYYVNRSPVNFMLTPKWFENLPESIFAFQTFMDYLDSLEDVWVVSHSEVLKWMRNPVSVSEYKVTQPDRRADCLEQYTCSYLVSEERKIMYSCFPCPDEYPWVGNPFGNSTYNL